MKGAAKYKKAASAELSAAAQNEYVEKYASLVKRIAYHLMSRLPPTVQVDDLIQSGMIGLLEAARNYDASQGASFETYAGIRIRGSMLDEIRKGDWAPRSLHRKVREISRAVAELEALHGRDARDEVRGRVRRDGTGRHLGYPGGDRRPARYDPGDPQHGGDPDVERR